MFARHGIPETVRSDNGPQYDSAVFAKFSKDWNFDHVTSSPNYAQSNGEVERAVQTVKNLLTKAEDPAKALLEYRATPLECNYSPAELLFGRKIRSNIPTIPSQLQPKWPDLDKFRASQENSKEEQSAYYNCPSPHSSLERAAARRKGVGAGHEITSNHHPSGFCTSFLHSKYSTWNYSSPQPP